jgi:hypothetical protein
MKDKMLQNQFEQGGDVMDWREALLLVEKSESYRKLGKVRFRWWNPRFEGEEIIQITSSPTRIEKLMDKLWEVNKNVVLKYVKTVVLAWSYSWQGDYLANESWILGDRTIFGRLVESANFEWTDKAMGIYWSTLKYDEKFLEELKHWDCEVKPFGKILHRKFESEAQKLSLKELIENIYYHTKTHNWEMVDFLKWQLYKRLENGWQKDREADELVDGILLVMLHEKDK